MKKTFALPLFFSLVLFLAIFITPSSADIAEPGKKTISPCVEIENIDDYDDYYFFMTNELVGGLVLLEKDKCVETLYKFGDHQLVVVKKSQINDDWLTTDSTGSTHASEDILAMNSTFRSDSLDLPMSDSVSVTDPRSGDHVTFYVNIEGGELTVSGAEIEKQYSWASLIPVAIIIGCGVISTGVVVFLILRLKKKPKTAKKSKK
ncbi:MAG: hypothetical protein US52_C0019G0005 [candidate division WS6 bacterium GW2011_GWA2_37_6]|uniref:Uncharacterized protein n=1 Tax=candidate division WS6 bacterium GW2011_GWA2_37_6 TaxID=1619087 RepID=A0A0G0GXF4_9BACT|nr:MAG: hypothetical protein US52_C0019G0005 [candidate division WS6 bacterium GW2011_GWA2_37_6]